MLQSVQSCSKLGSRHIVGHDDPDIYSIHSIYVGLRWGSGVGVVILSVV